MVLYVKFEEPFTCPSAEVERQGTRVRRCQCGGHPCVKGGKAWVTSEPWGVSVDGRRQGHGPHPKGSKASIGNEEDPAKETEKGHCDKGKGQGGP